MPLAMISFLVWTISSEYFARNASLTIPFVSMLRSFPLRNSMMACVISASEGPGRKGRSSSELSIGEEEIRSLDLTAFLGVGFFAVLTFFGGGSSSETSSSSSSESSTTVFL
jgi:hypothetical protein